MSDRSLDDNLVDIPQEESNPIPYNVAESERSILALCMRSKEALSRCAGKRVVPEDFADKRNENIYFVIRDLYLGNRSVSRVSVCEELRTKGLLSKAGGDGYVYDVANTQCVMSSMDDFIKVVLADSQSRKLLNALDGITNMAKKREMDVNSIVDTAVGQLNGVKISEEDDSGFEHLAPILKRNLAELERAVKEGKDRDTVLSGFSYLDNITGGFRPGSLNIIAARPGMGKTALALNIATNVAGIYSKTVVIFSLEMSKAEIVNRILATLSNTSFKAIERAKVTKEELSDLEKTVAMMSNLNIYIDERTDTNPSDIMNKCKALNTTTPISLIIIDYLGLITMPGRGGGSRQNEVAEISRSLKVLAKELKVPVIALSQLNRGTENREDGDHTPGLADIRDSGAIEQDADCVLFIHRPDYYNKGKQNKEKNRIEDAQIIVAKNRHGATDVAYVKWMGEKTRFFEADKKSDPQDPQASAYTRTTSPDSASGDYQFGEPPPEDPYEAPYEAPDYDSVPFDQNPENEQLFGGDDVHDGFPEGF